ncbi:hypothetical protein B0T21DRAFT_104864 [Apiosordaria backusii]|uniref:Uncharacterized protein n=1 Tax=Apiosordaria backusii TaxID=314023 RepID=A0AA40DHX4_9PEZI|nr:hypothetical protein B0T21DRAFT_104864 [Apiosordaria backusii]
MSADRPDYTETKTVWLCGFWCFCIFGFKISILFPMAALFNKVYLWQNGLFFSWSFCHHKTVLAFGFWILYLLQIAPFTLYVNKKVSWCMKRSAGVVVIRDVCLTKGARFDPWVNQFLKKIPVFSVVRGGHRQLTVSDITKHKIGEESRQEGSPLKG